MSSGGSFGSSLYYLIREASICRENGRLLDRGAIRDILAARQYRATACHQLFILSDFRPLP